MVYTRSFQYDAAGNQTVMVDRNGRATKYYYDDGNRLLAENWFPTLTDLEHETNHVGYVTQNYDSAGRVQYAATPDSEYNYITTSRTGCFMKAWVICL